MSPNETRKLLEERINELLAERDKINTEINAKLNEFHVMLSRTKNGISFLEPQDQKAIDAIRELQDTLDLLTTIGK